MNVTTSVALLVLLQDLPAQDPEARPARTDALGLVDRAEKLHKTGSSEEATRVLRRAAQTLHAEPRDAVHDALRKTVARLLGQADPSCDVFDAAFAKSGAELIRASQIYRRRRWFRVAARLLDDAESLSPALVARERKRPGTRKLRSASRRAKKSKGPEDLIPKFRPDDNQGWDVGTRVIRSPPQPDSSSPVIIGSVKLSRDGVVSLEVKRPNTLSLAAMVFGARGYDDYFIFDLVYYEGTGCAAIAYHWKDRKLHDLGLTYFNLPKEQRGDWLRHVVHIEGKKATLFIGNKKLFSIECGREPYGRIGMHVSGASEYKGPVHYRKLFVRELPEKRSAVVDTKPMLEAIRTAEQLLDIKKNEKATLILLDARRTTERMSEGVTKKTLRETIQELHHRADRSHVAYEKSRVTAAAPLVDAARSYVKMRWFFLARDVLREAQRLHPPAGAALMSEIDAAVTVSKVTVSEEKPAIAEKAGPAPALGIAYAAEEQGAARNVNLLFWFDGGRQPYDTDAWRVTEDGIHSPVKRLGGTLLLSTGELSKTAKFSIQVRCGRNECIPGIAFGFKTIYSYYFLSWRHLPRIRSTFVQMYRVDGNDAKRVGPVKSVRFARDAFRKWMTVGVEFQEKKVRIKLGTAPAFVVPVPGGNLAGQFGLHTTVVKTRQPVQFRNLVIERQ